MNLILSMVKDYGYGPVLFAVLIYVIINLVRKGSFTISYPRNKQDGKIIGDVSDKVPENPGLGD